MTACISLVSECFKPTNLQLGCLQPHKIPSGSASVSRLPDGEMWGGEGYQVSFRTVIAGSPGIGRGSNTTSALWKQFLVPARIPLGPLVPRGKTPGLGPTEFHGGGSGRMHTGTSVSQKSVGLAPGMLWKVKHGACAKLRSP